MATEPTTIRAKTTIKWTRSAFSYSAENGYVLRYEFRSSVGGFNVDASGSGTTHTVSQTSNQTANYVAGDYRWELYALKGSDLNNPDERSFIDEGFVTVLANTSAASAHDFRSQVKKILDAIETMITGKASRDVEEYEISTGDGSRKLKHIALPELIELRATYSTLYKQELLRGGHRKSIIKPKFNN